MSAVVTEYPEMQRQQPVAMEHPVKIFVAHKIQGVSQSYVMIVTPPLQMTRSVSPPCRKSSGVQMLRPSVKSETNVAVRKRKDLSEPPEQPGASQPSY